MLWLVLCSVKPTSLECDNLVLKWQVSSLAASLTSPPPTNSLTFLTFYSVFFFILFLPFFPAI